MTQVRPPFPAAVDSTMLKTFRECPRKFELEYLYHWKSRKPSIHLHAGQAFASGLEEVRRAFHEDKLPAADSLASGAAKLIEAYATFEEPHDTAKTLPRMLGALEYYFDVWPLETDHYQPWQYDDGKFAIEFSFASPLPWDNPETGEPVIYTGRSDMLAVQRNDSAIWILDDKTTSQLGQSWVNQWDLRSQFTGYTWHARKVSAIPIMGCVVRGVSILKTKYDHAEVPTYRPDWQIDRWLTQVLHDLERMKLAWETGYFDFNLDEACNSYSGCLFRRICLSSPEAVPEWLAADYEKRVWDPLKREERKVVETVVDLGESFQVVQP